MFEQHFSLGSYTKYETERKLMKTLDSNTSLPRISESLQLIFNESGAVVQALPHASTFLLYSTQRLPFPLDTLLPPLLVQEIMKWVEKNPHGSHRLQQSSILFGKPFFLDIQALSIPGSQRHFILSFSPAQDALETWNESASKYKTLFESSKTGILLVDWEHRKALEANMRMAELFQTPIEEILQGNMMNFSPDKQPDGRKSSEAFREIMNRVKGYQEFIWQFKRADGSLFDAEVSISPIELHGIMCGVYIIRDISPIKKQKKELEKYIKSNLQLENFVYIASHDLREPLLTAIGFCKQFKKMYGSGLDERGNMLLNTIISRTEYMNTLIEELFIYSRVQNDQIPFEWMDAEEMVREVLQALENSFKSHRVSFLLDTLPSPILGSKEQLSRLFQNLLSNAIKFSTHKENAEIHIGGRENGAFWEFWVKDNGMGIPEEHFEKIFALFQRLHNKKEYTGIGIGLAICKQITENHKGRIWVESEVGLGSKFSFSIKKPA